VNALQMFPMVGLTFGARSIVGSRAKVTRELPIHKVVILELFSRQSAAYAVFENYQALCRRHSARAIVDGHSDVPAEVVISSSSIVGFLHDRNTLRRLVQCVSEKTPLNLATLSAEEIIDLSHDENVRTAIHCENLLNLQGRLPSADRSPHKIVEFAREASVCNLAGISEAIGSSTLDLAQAVQGFPQSLPPLERPAFDLVVDELVSLGFLSPPVGEIQWGHFDRLSPFCPHYGFSRGTPIDRHYLHRFIDTIRAEVSGATLEIGGRSGNKAAYGFDACDHYAALDVSEGGGVDIAADVHDPAAWRDLSLDSVLAFNVLEHCESPWLVVENIHRWLKPGGKFFCLVPNAQRVHRDPKDLWRILPDGLERLLSPFGRVRITTYGSMVTFIAALAGVSAEEVPPDRLDAIDRNYPVVTCAVAERV
jgi:SAM-dependent methyltransferase